MRKPRHALWTLLCVVLLAFAQTVFAAPSAPDPAQKGPYAIGHTSFVLSDSSRSGAPDFLYRPIPVSVWYPVAPATIQSSTSEASYLWDPIYNSSQLPWPASVSSNWEPYGIDRAYQEPTPASVRHPGYAAVGLSCDTTADSSGAEGVSKGQPLRSTYSSQAPASCDVRTAVTMRVV